MQDKPTSINSKVYIKIIPPSFQDNLFKEFPVINSISIDLIFYR